MKTIEHIRTFLDPFVTWASRQPDLQGVGLVGSYARGKAWHDSDIDLVILTDLPQKALPRFDGQSASALSRSARTKTFVKRLHSSFSFLLPGGVTDLQIEVLYSSTQYYFVVGLTTALCPYPDIVAHDNRNI